MPPAMPRRTAPCCLERVRVPPADIFGSCIMVGPCTQTLQGRDQGRSPSPRAVERIVSARTRRPCPDAHGPGETSYGSVPVVSSLVQRNKVVAKRKGALAAVTVGGAAVVA